MYDQNLTHTARHPTFQARQTSHLLLQGLSLSLPPSPSVVQREPIPSPYTYTYTFSPAWRIQPESHKQLHNLVWSSLHAPQLIPKLINDPPTCYPTHRISSCYIQSSHPIRSTLMLKSCTRKHILQTSLVSSVYLTSFHPSHCQTPGTAHLHILSACPSCSVQIRVRTKEKSSYTQISLENTNKIKKSRHYL